MDYQLIREPEEAVEPPGQTVIALKITASGEVRDADGNLVNRTEGEES